MLRSWAKLFTAPHLLFRVIRSGIRLEITNAGLWIRLKMFSEKDPRWTFQILRLFHVFSICRFADTWTQIQAPSRRKSKATFQNDVEFATVNRVTIFLRYAIRLRVTFVSALEFQFFWIFLVYFLLLCLTFIFCYHNHVVWISFKKKKLE